MPVPDPLLLGQRIVAVLETGKRVATYKLATLMALVDHAIEHIPEDPDAELAVPLTDLAARVVELYWHQVRPFDGRVLRQSEQSTAKIPRAVAGLRDSAGVGVRRASVETAAGRVPDAYARAIDEVVLCLAQQPLHYLQRLPGAERSDCFLFDDSHLHKGIGRRTLREHGDAIVLFPGVAAALARLAGLLKPTLEIMWVEDVRRLNAFLDQDVPDVAGHLFGRDRVSLAPVREAYNDVFGARCFYCDRALRAGDPVDHVLPWSLLGIDGLANLVLACTRCNGDKSNSLPSPDLLDRVLSRDRGLLESIAADLEWPTQYDRVVSAARGVFRSQPQGSPTWAGYRSAYRLDLSFFPWLVDVPLPDRPPPSNDSHGFDGHKR